MFFWRRKGGSCKVLLTGVLLWPVILEAECRITGDFTNAVYSLTNGVAGMAEPEVVFQLSGANLGDGNPVASGMVINSGSTLANHVRFRLNIKEKGEVHMPAISSAPLSCINCASNTTIPFTSIGWEEGISANTLGQSPGSGQFVAGTQTWITGRKNNNGTNNNGNKDADSIFHLRFNFANDQIYPAGTYKGAFFTRGEPNF